MTSVTSCSNGSSRTGDKNHLSDEPTFVVATWSTFWMTILSSNLGLEEKSALIYFASRISRDHREPRNCQVGKGNDFSPNQMCGHYNIALGRRPNLGLYMSDFVGCFTAVADLYALYQLLCMHSHLMVIIIP